MQQAILQVQQAMRSGNPASVMSAYQNYNKTQAAFDKAKGDKKAVEDEATAADENIRILEKGVQGTLDALKKVGRTGSKGGGGGGSKGVSQIESLRRTVGDLDRALDTGAMGAELGFLTQSYAAERDKKGTGAETRQLLERQAALQAEKSIESIRRQAKQQEELTAVMGKGREEIRAVEIAQKVLNFEIDTFGTAKSPQAKKAVDDYKKALEEQAIAADKAAASQKALNAEQQAALSRALLAGASDQRSQDRIRFEQGLAKDLEGMGDPAERARYEKARREEFANQQAMQEKKITEELQEQARMQGDELRLSILSTRELEVQRQLLAKQNELRKLGVDPNSAFYKDTMGETERLARQGQANGDLVARNRKIITGFEQAADDVSDLFGKAFDDAFEYGLKGAGSNFLKGMGSIFKQMGNDLVYELAVRPVQELLRNLARVAAQKLILSLFGGPSSAALGADASATISANPSIFAAGGAFGTGGYRAFAEGGAFTNSIVNRPTLFAFAGGTGLMGEAGPEAIMPLKRGANGKLGVEGGAGGGDVTVVVNDMRSSPQAQPVETSEKRGPDGKRMISVMIRDEVRRQIRSGDLDREMSSSYGAVRTIARK